tara:strand:- start:5 stop:7156 length:7152 start_codon:yes stop_codon:yes gene_type:complete
MAQYQLENGQTLNVPDDLDPTKRAQIAEDVKSVYGIDINEVSVLDRILDAPKSIARGALSLATDVPLGLAGLVDIGDDSKVVKGLQGFQDFLRTDSSLASDPALRDKYTTKLAEGIGSYAPFLGAGLAGRALAKRGIVSKTAGTYGIPSALAIPSGMAAQVDKAQMARDMGEEVGPISETFGTLTGGVIGITEILPIINILKKVPKVRDKGEKDFVISKLKSAAQSGVLEGGQEVTASLLQDLTARGLYSDELPIGESMFDEFTIGGIIGGGADLLFNSLGGKRGVANEYLKDRESKARGNKIYLEDQNKLEKAVAQGEVTEYQEPTIVSKPDIPVPGVAGIEPQLELTVLADGSVGVIDLQATEDSVLASAPTEIEALALKEKIKNQYERDKLKSRLENDLYSMGLSESDTAYKIGATVLDPNSTQVNLQTLLNFDPKYTEKKKNKKIDTSQSVTSQNIGSAVDAAAIKSYVEQKNIKYKTNYTMTEAKQFLNPSAFNQMTSQMAEVVFSQSEKSGEPSIRLDNGKFDTSSKYLKEIALSKNINLDVNTVAFDRFNTMVTGGTGFRSGFGKMSNGQKELLLARIHSLPKFNTKTDLPDFRVREYTAQDMADFVATVGSAEFTYNDIETYLKNRFTGRQSQYYGAPEFRQTNTLDQEIELNDGILDEQVTTFGSDLRKSGRAETPEGSKPTTLRIRDNFEFDIARKAEAFNETPEEFGARLTGENKLPKETIDQLIEFERVRQEKVLPPVAIKPKIMNFAEVVEEGRTNKFAKEIKKKLNKLGLKETGVIVSNEIISSKNLIANQKGKIVFDPTQTRQEKTEVQYDSNTDTIFLSLNAVNPDGTATDIEIQNKLNSIIDAQVIHAFRAKDLINEKEYNFLRKEVRRRKVPVGFDEQSKGKTFYERSKNINESKLTDLQKARGVDFIDEFYVESAIADLYKAKDIKPDIPPKAKGIFDKFLNFFKGIGTAMRSSGYRKSSEIFNDIEAGKIGSRARGEIRTLRELDKLSIRSETDAIFEVEETEKETIDDSSTLSQEDIERFNIAGATFLNTKNTNFVSAKNKKITGKILSPSKDNPVIYKDKLYDYEKLTDIEREEEGNFILNNTINKNAIGVMEWFVENAPSQDYKVIAEAVLKRMKKLNKNNDLTFDFTYFDDAFLAQKTSDPIIMEDLAYLKKKRNRIGGVSMYPAEYGGRQGNFRIFINNTGPLGSRINGVHFRTILHEAVHSVTQAATLLGDPEYKYTTFFPENVDPVFASSYKNLENLRLALRKAIRVETGLPVKEYPDHYVKYGLKNVDELLAVGLTDRKFQKFMESVKYKQEGKKNIWDAFVNEIRKLLGLQAKAGTAFSVFLKEASNQLSLNETADRQIVNYFTSKLDQSSDPETDPLTSRGPPQKINVFENSSRSPNPTPSLIDAVEKAEELVKKTPIGQIPPYNIKASDVALKAAQDYAVDPSPRSIKPLAMETAEVPEEFKAQAEQSGHKTTKLTFGERFIDLASDPVTNIKSSLNRLRTEIIDKYDDIDKAITKGSETNEEVRLLNNAITTSSIAAIRLADKARGVFAQMLTRGTPASQIEGQESSTFVKEFEFSAEHNNFIKDSDIGKGGLLQFTAPLYENPTVDLEFVFGLYSKLKRIKKMQDNGIEIETPPSLKDLEQIKYIENNYKNVVEVYKNYQKWNNELVKFARNKGLLSEGQAKQWIKHSSYYPFYREMIDDEGRSAPSIGGGMLPGNPLSIKMEGSEKEINVPPLEAIARNSLSILTASMKNDGLAKLVRDMQLMDMARPKNPKTKPNAMTVFVFEDGEKKIYQIDDREIFEAVRSVGGVKVDALTKAFSMPAGFLRDMITRDPGFIVVNILRDTLSSAVTSGAKLGIGGDTFTPIVDSVANMFKDMTDLEKFGIVGGYDFANDEGDIVRYMSRARRQQGLTPGNGISLENAFFKLWDGLGGLTTKSDGATRLAVYNSVYNDLKKQGASEAEAQSAAAYQGLEIINFGRRGSSQFFGMITAAIPFLNARIQGLDILYRTSRGRYSATEKLQSGESAQDLKKRITRTALLRGLSLMGITLLYYLMVSDTEDYKEAKREVRDDNWLIPTPFDYTLKIPIPFEIGAVFKAIPERMFDLAAGQIKEDGSVEKDTTASIARQIQTATNIPFLMGDISIQAIKPFFEAVTNRNSFTGTEIVPYYKQKGQAGLQSNPQTNEVARLIGELFNISPMKIEYVMKGYTGTLGGYALAVADSIARTATGSPYIPNNIVSNPTNFTRLPFVNRLIMDTKKMGGLQQGFYELRQEVDKVTQTLNSLRKQGRFDELASYRENYQGVSNVKSQVRALEKYMVNFRKRRDAIMKREDISIIVKSDLIRDLEIDRDKRLSIVPALRARANVPILQGGL